MSVRFGLRLATACLALISLSKPGLSQTKIAIVSLQRAVLGCAEIKQASKAMEDKYKPRQQEMERLQKELAGIQQQLQTNAGKLTPAAESDLNAQGQHKQRELQRLNDDLQADVTAERNDVLGASGRKMKDIVQKLAQEKGVDLIVDEQSTLFFKPALDLTADAIAAYDKAYPAK
jgi:outer membrane protein